MEKTMNDQPKHKHPVPERSGMFVFFEQIVMRETNACVSCLLVFSPDLGEVTFQVCRRHFIRAHVHHQQEAKHD